MRVDLEKEAEKTPLEGTGTRGQRARANAVARLKARHAERDFMGRAIGIDDVREEAPTVSQAKGGTRLDAWLVAHGYAASRDKAKALIDAGCVRVKHVTKVKGSTVIVDDARVEVLADEGTAQ